MIIYLIQGSTGRGDDNTQWIFKEVYESEQAAYLKLSLLREGLPEYMTTDTKQFYYDINTRDAFIRTRREVDPDFQMDYTGTEYKILERELV